MILIGLFVAYKLFAIAGDGVTKEVRDQSPTLAFDAPSKSNAEISKWPLLASSLLPVWFLSQMSRLAAAAIAVAQVPLSEASSAENPRVFFEIEIKTDPPTVMLPTPAGNRRWNGWDGWMGWMVAATDEWSTPH